jgi:AAA family ATP:ADP antiporter
VTSRDLAIATAGAATFGAVLASYFAFRPVRDALVLDGNPDQIPWLFTASFLAVTAISPLWSKALARWSPRRLVPAAFHVFAACEVVFFILVGAEVAPVTVGRVFYVWSAVFNLFVVSVLWSLFADLLGPRAAKTLYGPIAAGGTAGAIAGPALTKLLADSIGVAGVLVMSAVLLELAAVGVWWIRRYAQHAAPEPEPPPVPGGALTGLAYVGRSPYLRAIVGYVLCTAIAATFVYLEQADIVKHHLPDRAARLDFFSSLELETNIGVMIVQAVVATPLLRWLGPGIVMCALPVLQGAGIVTLALEPTLAALAIVSVTTRIATHGLTRPSREVLFTAIDRDAKYRAKNAIDTVAYRLGDFTGSWMIYAGAGGTLMLAVTGPLVAGWLVLALFLGVSFSRLTSKEPA